MPPPNARDGETHPRRCAAKAAARAALVAVCLLASLLGVRAADAPALREKDVRRAEKVVAKLRRLDEAAAARGDAKAYRALAAGFYPGLFVTVADMRESDLKTDLDTAVFLYAKVGQTWFDADSLTADCERERPDIYRPLCLELRGGNLRQLLLSKARLHAGWAESVVKNYRGRGDAGTSRALASMRAARADDQLIAARVVEVLRPLEEMLTVSQSFADYQERRALSRISFDKLEGEFVDALGNATGLLASMSRGPAFYHLSSARDSYRDGLFWYRKVGPARRMVVSANAFGRDPLREARLDADQVGYTVSVNWKAAAKYTRLAEQSLSLPGRR
ncbi:MAG TPA: hypothetical protein VIP46_12295 [Pyrinomonadaceae bacterium]